MFFVKFMVLLGLFVFIIPAAFKLIYDITATATGFFIVVIQQRILGGFFVSYNIRSFPIVLVLCVEGGLVRRRDIEHFEVSGLED